MATQLKQMMPHFLPFSVPGRDVISGPRPLRQLWGLAVRCERAMRAIAPHWQVQKASWGEAACMFGRLVYPAMWVCQFAATKSEDSQSLPAPVIQLLASSVATVLKAARVTDIHFLLNSLFMSTPALKKSVPSMLPAALSLLLPRMAGTRSLQGTTSTLLSAARSVDSALLLTRSKDLKPYPFLVLGSCHMTTLVYRTSAELLHCSGPTTTRHNAHSAAGSLSSYAAFFSMDIAVIAVQACEGAPSGSRSAPSGSAPSGSGSGSVPSGSAQLRDLLTRPLLLLLHSPMLDTLVALQHVMVGKLPDLQQRVHRRLIHRRLIHMSAKSVELDGGRCNGLPGGHAGGSHLLLSEAITQIMSHTIKKM